MGSVPTIYFIPNILEDQKTFHALAYREIAFDKHSALNSYLVKLDSSL